MTTPAHPYDLLATELRHLAGAEGAELWRNRIRLTGLLLDAQPDLRREIRAIVSGVEQGVAAALADTERSLSGIAIDRQANLLETESGLRPEIALNVARTLAHALDLGPLPSVYGHPQAAPPLPPAVDLNYRPTPAPAPPPARPEATSHQPWPHHPPSTHHAYDSRRRSGSDGAQAFPWALVLIGSTVLVGGGVLTATLLPLGGNSATTAKAPSQTPTPTPGPTPTPPPSPPAAIALGQWEYVFTATGVESDTAPQAALEQMRAQIGQPQRRTFCVNSNDTSNMAQQLSNSLSQSMGQQASCNLWKETFADGVVDLAGTCQAPTGTLELAITGNYSATTSSTSIVMDLNAQGQAIRIRASETGRHLGPCPG